MRRPLLTSLCLFTLTAAAQLPFPSAQPVWPHAAIWPAASPMNPFTTLGAPAPLPGLGFNPYAAGPTLGSVAPLLGGLGHVGLQMAPNWLSHQHLAYMTNPYLGGPAAGNPYLQASLPLPFAPPAFSPSLPQIGPTQTGMRWPSAPGPFNPYLPAVPGRAAVPWSPPAGQGVPVDPTGWLGQMARPPGR